MSFQHSRCTYFVCERFSSAIVRANISNRKFRRLIFCTAADESSRTKSDQDEYYNRFLPPKSLRSLTTIVFSENELDGKR